MPIVGPSVDRRCMDHLVQVYNDRRTRSLICFCCAQVKTDTGTHRSPIEERSGRWLYNLSPSTLMRNFSFANFQHYYCKPGTPLAQRGSGTNPSDCLGPDFSDWVIQPHPDTLQHINIDRTDKTNKRATEGAVSDRRMNEFLASPILCCPRMYGARVHALIESISALIVEPPYVQAAE